MNKSYQWNLERNMGVKDHMILSRVYFFIKDEEIKKGKVPHLKVEI